MLLDTFLKEDFALFGVWFNYKSKLSNIDSIYSIHAELNKLCLLHYDTISRHNKNLKFSSISDKNLLEKFKEWRGHNTPKPSLLNITPFHNTGFGIYSNNYDQWRECTLMLILEYNYLKKSFLYMVSDKENSLSPEFKNCYIYWEVRQAMFYEISYSFFNKLNEGNVVLGNNYIPIFTLDKENLHREILEDFLYVALNILLAKAILENTKLIQNLNNEELYFEELNKIFKEHFINYKVEYDYLYKLREHLALNYFSLDELNKL